MKVKNGNWKFLFSALFIAIALTFNNVFASDNYDIVRVGITDNKFQNVLKQNITIFGTAECELCDKATRKVITKITPNTDINIRQSDRGLVITIGYKSGIFQDVVIVCPQGLLGVKGLLRK